MLNILISVLFGFVEGITEWLPISSTGHMILLRPLVPFDVSESFYALYEVVIQFGAILAVILLFWKTIFPLTKTSSGLALKKGTMQLWVKIFISTIPAAVIGILFDDVIDDLFYKPGPVAMALIVFGVAFLVVEYRNRSHKPSTTSLRELTIRQAIYIGLFQVLAAIFPGTSRSGATILGAILLGVSRGVAAEYTFFLAIPVMAGASLLKIIKYVKYAGVFGVSEALILFVGMFTAFVVSLIVIRKLMKYVREHSFSQFGIYRIVLGILVLIFFGSKGLLWSKI